MFLAVALICGLYKGGDLCVEWKAQTFSATRAECIAKAQEMSKLGKTAFWYARVPEPHRIKISCLQRR